MKIICVSQARMGSSRLPGKILKKIKAKTLLAWHYERIAQSKLIDQHIIAISNTTKDQPIVDVCENQSWQYFQGSEHHVLERFYQTAEYLQLSPHDLIIRVTSDCPLIDGKLVDKLINMHIKENLGGISNIDITTYPRGFDAEVFSMSALTNMYHSDTSAHQQEHVTPYLYAHPEAYPVKHLNLQAKLDASNLRLCVDEVADFRLIEKLIENYPDRIEAASAESIIRFLLKNPEIANLNKNVQQKS